MGFYSFGMVARCFDLTLDHTNYLSLQVVLSEVIGDPLLIVLVGLLLVNFLAIKFNVAAKPTIFLNVLAALALVGFAWQSSVVVIVALVLSLLIFGTYAAFFNR